MMELRELEDTISTIVKRGELVGLLRSVTVLSAKYEDDDFLRVEIRLAPTDEDIDDALETIIHDVEDAVAEVDTRYPSVRFPDAA